MIKEFSEEVSVRLGNYVYRLIDPRNGDTFYVGKGKGNRIFAHIHGQLKAKKRDEEEDQTSLKMDRIQEIHNAKLEVVHIIHRHEIPDEAVFHVEAALIDAYPGLTNIQGGHGSTSYGPMHVDEINIKYGLPSFEDDPPHKLVLININGIRDRSNAESIYQQVRSSWKISKTRVSEADFILAVIRGVVVGVFTADEWVKVEDTGRYEFNGKSASIDVWQRYAGQDGKRVTNPLLKHIQYPIRYWKC
jgi:hypothetical protein